MAGEISIPFVMKANRTNNANASWDTITLTNNNIEVSGYRLPDTLQSDLSLFMARPVPTNINGTPAGKVKVYWVTASADANDVKFFIYASDYAVNSGSVDISSYDDSLTVTDTNNGAGVVNEAEVSLSSTTQTSGKWIEVLLRRNAADAADTLAADIVVQAVLYVADEA